MSDEAVKIKHDPSEGYDASEPKTMQIWAFTIGSVITLVVLLFALQQYFDKLWNDAVYEKVLSQPSQLLETVQHRDDWDLTHYEYLDKKTGQIRIPLDEARGLFLKEVAAGKPFYPGKPSVPKPEDLQTVIPGDYNTTSTAGGAAASGAAPAAGAAATKTPAAATKAPAGSPAK